MNIEKLSTEYLGGAMFSSPEGATIKLHYGSAAAAEDAFVELTDAIDQAKPFSVGETASRGEPTGATPHQLFMAEVERCGDQDMSPEARRAAMSYFILGLTRNTAGHEVLAARLEELSELLAEASTVLEAIPPEVLRTLPDLVVRFPLADELHGASVIARDEAKLLRGTEMFKGADAPSPGGQLG